MTRELIEKDFKELMEIEGEARGVTFKTDAEFVLRTEGEDGLKKVEEELRRLGYPIKYKEIETMAFYPIGLRVISLLVIKKVFGFDDQGIKNMGSAAPKVSLVMKLFMQYFLSIRATFGQVPQIWKKHYTAGELVPVKLDEKGKTLTLRIENFNPHPVFCSYISGYLLGVMRMVVKGSVFCQETKCFFRGDEYHEYLFKW